MLFEVLFDGKVRASTSYLECIPTKNTLLDMEHASDLFTCDRLTGSTAGKNMFYNCNSLVGGNGTKYADIFPFSSWRQYSHSTGAGCLFTSSQKRFRLADRSANL